MSDSPQDTNIYYARIKKLQESIDELEYEHQRMIKWMEGIDERLGAVETTTHDEQIERKLNTAVCDKVGKTIEDAIDDALSFIDVGSLMVETAKAVEELHEKLTEKYPNMYFGQDQLVRRMNKWRRDSVR